MYANYIVCKNCKEVVEKAAHGYLPFSSVCPYCGNQFRDNYFGSYEVKTLNKISKRKWYRPSTWNRYEYVEKAD